MIDINTVIANLKGPVDLLLIALKARDEAKVQAAISEIQERLLQANLSALDITAKAADLQAQLTQEQAHSRELQAKLAHKQAYKLHALPSGALVLRYQTQQDPTVPPHDICQACDSEGRHSVLQPSQNGNLLLCPREPAHKLSVHGGPQPSGRSQLSPGI